MFEEDNKKEVLTKEKIAVDVIKGKRIVLIPMITLHFLTLLFCLLILAFVRSNYPDAVAGKIVLAVLFSLWAGLVVYTAGVTVVKIRRFRRGEFDVVEDTLWGITTRHRYWWFSSRRSKEEYVYLFEKSGNYPYGYIVPTRDEAGDKFYVVVTRDRKLTIEKFYRADAVEYREK